MTVKQVIRYIENNDSSVISYKRFNESPEDQYPTFTFCLANEPLVVYNNELHKFGITKDDYYKLLSGSNSSVDTYQEKMNRIAGLEHAKFTIQLTNPFHWDFCTSIGTESHITLVNTDIW